MNYFLNINEDITDSLVDNIIGELENSVTDDTTLFVTIHSVGGQLDAAKRLASVVASFNNSIAFTDLCYSAATVIFLSAKKRLVSDDVQFLIHQPTLALNGNKEEHLLAADVLSEVEQDLIDFYCQFTDIENFYPYYIEELLIPTDELERFNFIN